METQKAQEADPDEEREFVTRFYSLDGDLELETLLEELGELDPKASLLEGPVADRGRPGQSFVALETSAETNLKRLERVLKKGGTLIITAPSISHARGRLSVLLQGPCEWRLPDGQHSR